MGVIAACLRYFEISQGRGKTTVLLVPRSVKIFGDTPLQLLKALFLWNYVLGVTNELFN